MSNIYDYIKWRGDLSFKSSGFNEVDGMLLSQLTYAPYEDMSFRYPITLQEAADRISKLKDLEKKVLFKGDAKLIYDIQNSPRFSDIVITGFVNRIDEETQFCAAVYKIEANLYFIAFRGTDETIAGWRENFNMGFIFPVPAQTEAMHYFENTVKKHMSSKYILGGHSKGGNLAVYAAAFSDKKYSDKIKKVYNYDGPGFGEGMLESEGYIRIKDRTETFVPQSSIIGMILEHEEDYTVIRSSAAENGLLQHELYSWEVEGTEFVRMEDVTKMTHIIDRSLKSWLADMSFKQREAFVDALFLALSEAKVKNVKELTENGFKNTAAVLKAISKFDDETKAMVIKVITKLISAIAVEYMG